MSLTAATLARMHTQISAGGSLFADRLAPGGPPGPAGFADLLAAACPNPGDNYSLALEYIFEGFLLHYRQGRLLEPAAPEFNLLAGDYMYARGLTFLATLEDLYCVQLMADLVSLCSFIHCQDSCRRQTFRAWVLATVCLAGRAAGAGGGPDCLNDFRSFRSSLLGGGQEAACGAQALDRHLAPVPAGGGGSMKNLLGELEAMYWGVPLRKESKDGD